MARCEVCGNEYDKAFRVTTAGGESHTFDSFECAIHVLAPACGHCGCRVLGHGVESNGSIFCCAHCARESGVGGLSDRAEDGQAAGEPAGAAPEQGIAGTRPPSES